MSTEIAELAFRAETGELVKARDLLKSLKKPAEEAETASGKLSDRIKKMGDAIDPVNSGFGKLIGTLKAVGAAMAAAFSIQQYAQLADTWSDLSARAGLAAGNMDLAGATMQRISQMARNSYSSLKNTAEGFIANAASLRELGYNANQTLDYVEGINNALVISGARGDRAESVMRALSKAMAVGKLDGEGLQSVLSNGGRIAQALAKELGTTTNGLRKMAAEGKITGSVIYNAMTKNLEELREEAGEMPATIEDGFTIIGNAILTLVGNFDKLTGISETVANFLVSFGDGIQWLAENLEGFFANIDHGISILSGLASMLGSVLSDYFAPMIGVVQTLGGYIGRLWDNVKGLIPTGREAAIAMGLLFGPAIIAGAASLMGTVIALTWSIGVGLVSAIGSATLAMIRFTFSNPFTAIPAAIGIALAAIYVFRDAISDALGFDVINAAKDGINGIISIYAAGMNSIRDLWSSIPGIIGDVAYKAASSVVDAVNHMINSNIDAINGLISSLPAWLGGNSGGITWRSEISGPENPYDGNASDALDKIKENFKEAFETDWVGGFTGAITAMSEQLTVAEGTAVNMADALGALGDAAGGDADGKGKGGAKKKLTELQKITEDFSKLSAPFSQATTAFNAAKDALENGIITNDQYAESLKRIEDAFLRAGGSAEQWAKITKDNTDSVSSKLKDLAEGALTELGDMFIELGTTGKFNFKEFASSIIKDLAKIAWQALVVKPLMGWFGGMFEKGGGFGGGGGKLMPFANGGAFTNSIVSKPTAFAFANGGALGVMGEAGPEAIMPLKRGSDGSLGVQLHGGGSRGGDSSMQFTYAPNYTIEAGATKEAVEELRKAREEDRRTFKYEVIDAIADDRKRNGRA